MDIGDTMERQQQAGWRRRWGRILRAYIPIVAAIVGLPTALLVYNNPADVKPWQGVVMSAICIVVPISLIAGSIMSFFPRRRGRG